MKLVKGGLEDDEDNGRDNIPYSAKKLMQIVKLWISSKIMVYADGYFASVAKAEVL